MLCEHKDNEI